MPLAVSAKKRSIAGSRSRVSIANAKGRTGAVKSSTSTREKKEDDGVLRISRGGAFSRTRVERARTCGADRRPNGGHLEKKMSWVPRDRVVKEKPVSEVKVLRPNGFDSEKKRKNWASRDYLLTEKQESKGMVVRPRGDPSEKKKNWAPGDLLFAEERESKGKMVVPVRDRENEGVDVDGKLGQNASVKRFFQKRVLDVSGKKIRGHEKDCEEDDSDGSSGSTAPRKRKRMIKLDPHDTSNKRLYDGVLDKDDVVQKEIELSKNAQFRAIRPSPSILSFVEDNLIGRRRLNELQNAGYNVKLPAPLDNIPFSTSTERERIEQNVFRNKLEFFAAAKISSSFPLPQMPEIAFAGRSNVGKSSMLNALTRQWGVVRVSDKPGYTQTINFFNLGSKLCLVDLPGYGFAYAKEEVKDAWEQLVKEYVSTRKLLRRVCLLVDTKWGMKPRDEELIDLMERSQTPYQIVLTKTDAVFPIDVARRAMQIQEDLQENKSIVNPVMMVSSKSGAGIRSLRSVLAAVRLLRL